MACACGDRGVPPTTDAEAAEDRALVRLQGSLTSQPAAASALPRPAPRVISSPPAEPQPAASDPGLLQPEVLQPEVGLSTSAAAIGSASDPEDWSEELAAVDVQLQRLGWDRNLESRYLERAFGHPSRFRLTAYADLLTYLKALRSLPQGSQPDQAPVPLRRRDLLNQCDELIARLGWDAAQGRLLLEREFQLSSRHQLSDEGLLQFNMALETELVNRDHPAASSP